MANSALVYEPKCGGKGSCRVSANKYSCARGAQINFEDLTPSLTYVGDWQNTLFQDVRKTKNQKNQQNIFGPCMSCTWAKTFKHGIKKKYGEQSECSFEAQVQNLQEFSSCWNPLEKWVGDCRFQRTGRIFFSSKILVRFEKWLDTAVVSTWLIFFSKLFSTFQGLLSLADFSAYVTWI
jgi:hypothetical protein